MNTRKFYLRQIFGELMPIYPLYALLLSNKGLSVQQISLLLIIWSLPVVFLEIPTGILADRWSRRNMIILGSLAKAACFFVWIFSNGFALFALGFVLWGVGGAFISGAEEALVFDSLKSQESETKFDVILGRGRFLSGISTIIACVSGGYIGMHFGMEYALYLSVVSGLISTYIAFSYKEINYYKSRFQQDKFPKDEQDRPETLKNAMSFIIHNKTILIFSLLAVMVVGTAGVLDEYDALIARDYGLTVSSIGIWSALRFVMIALGSYLAHHFRTGTEKLLKRKDMIYTVGFLCLISAICLGLSGFIRRFEIMGIYGLFYLIMSASEILQEDFIQQKIEDEGRSTVHSIISLTYNLYGMVICGLIGLILFQTDLHGLLVLMSGYITILVVILSIVYSRYKKKSITDKE